MCHCVWWNGCHKGLSQRRRLPQVINRQTQIEGDAGLDPGVQVWDLPIDRDALNASLPG